MAHRNLTSTSLNDISDKPEKDQVSSRPSLFLGMSLERSWMLGKGLLCTLALETRGVSIFESCDWFLQSFSTNPCKQQVHLLQGLKQVTPCRWHLADPHEKGGKILWE